MKMKNISIRAYSEETMKPTKEINRQEKSNGTVIQANEMNLSNSMNATEKRINKERGALKIKLDQMLSDQKYSNEMEEHTTRKKELQEESLNNQNEVKRMEELKQAVKESYGIENESQEQKKLEQIEEIREKQKSGVFLTEDEINLLNDTESLTDYQKLVLEYDEAIDEFQKRAEKSQINAIEHGNAVDRMKQALLEVHPMVNASKQANKMIISALEEEKNALFAEMKENYDEKVEQEKEKAEEVKEKREEKYENQEKRTNDEVTNEILEMSNEITVSGQLVKKKLLLEEDLKGIEVDETI